VSGGPKVCLDCNDTQHSTVLVATGTPGGGTYTWPPPYDAKVTVTPRADKAWVKGKAHSVAEGDVTVNVTYVVKGATCYGAAKLTVIKPTSLNVLQDATYLAANGVFAPALQGALATAMAGTTAKLAADRTLVGALRVRSYEVLDQFGKRWLCDGRLDETITPKLPDMKTGGIHVTQGLPDQPDHLFYIHHLTSGPKKKPINNFPQTVVQNIQVSRCDVGHFRLTFNSGSVDVTRLP
jgi:hypothetical protein